MRRGSALPSEWLWRAVLLLVSYFGEIIPQLSIRTQTVHWAVEGLHDAVELDGSRSIALGLGSAPLPSYPFGLSVLSLSSGKFVSTNYFP